MRGHLAWIQNLKVGDLVIKPRHSYIGPDEIWTVKKLNKTQVSCDKGAFRTDGLVIGSKPDYVWVQEATPERLAEITRNNLAKKLKAVKFESLTTKALQDILAITINQENQVKPDGQ